MSAQWTGSDGNVPLSQGQWQGSPTNSQALPDDWPQPLSVPGMEKVTGLAQGDNNLSYSVHIISQEGEVNFQVKAFCVYNPVSEYAILHILDKPLVGVVDPAKKTLQIDFSPLATGLRSVEIIDKADVDKVLLQEPDSLVLNTVMSVQSMDSSRVKFSISDMSLLQPDGVLNEFSLPGPVPAIYDPVTARFSTVAFDELTNALQQNFVYIQQNTVINVVNQVNVVNIINVVDFGGFGCGGWGGIPYGGYGYGGWPDGGFGGYGGYGGYGGPCGYGYGSAPYSEFMPYSDPLPLLEPQPAPPLTVPPDVPIYDAKPRARPGPEDMTTTAPTKLPRKGKVSGPTSVAGDKGEHYKDKAPVLSTQSKRSTSTPAIKASAQPKPIDVKNVKAPNTKTVQDSVKTPVKTTQASMKGTATKAPAKTPVKQRTSAPMAEVTSGSVPVKQSAVKSAPVPKTAAVGAKTPDSKPVKRAAPSTAPAAKTAVAKSKAPDSKPAGHAVSRPATKTAVTKTTPNNAQAKTTAPKVAPASKTASVPKSNVVKSSKPQQVAKAPVQSAPAKSSAPKAAYHPAKAQQAPVKAVSQAKPAAARGAPAKGGGHK